MFKRKQNDDLISQYEQSLKVQGYSPEIIQGIRQGLNYGHPEIQQWIEQYNQGAGRKTPINIPQTQEEIALAQQGQFNNPRLEVGGISDKSSIMEKLADGISDFSTGFNENKNNAFMPSNLTDNKFSNGEEKRFMGRLGEAFGTIRRSLDKPVVQGLTSGLINTALTGNPMYGLIAGSGMAGQKAMSDVYAQALRNEGFDVPTGLFNTYGSSDLTAMTNPEIKKRQAESLINYRQERNDIDRTYKENRIKNEQRKIENQANKTTKKDVTQQDGWNEALAGYSQRINDPRYSDKLDQLKAKFIARYGVDPDKYLKD